MKKVNLIDLNKNIIKGVYIKNLYDFNITLGFDFYSMELCYEDRIFKGIVINNTNQEIILKLLEDKEFIDTFPVELEQYRAIEDNKKVKISRVSFSKGTGNSSKGSYSTFLYIPISWLGELGINKDNNKVVMQFDGKEIVIRSVSQR